MASGLQLRRLTAASGREFAELARIYEDVLPASERKDRPTLEAMLAREASVFSVGELDGEIVAFAIRTTLAGTQADTLEYMGVDRAQQGRGLGRALFTEVAEASAAAGRLLLLEVESQAEAADPAERRRRERRKAFYRDLGCREITALTYLMPNLGGGEPPKMNVMLCGRDLPATVSRTEVRAWIEAIYAQVYGRDPGDPAISAMVAGLPDAAPVI